MYNIRAAAMQHQLRFIKVIAISLSPQWRSVQQHGNRGNMKTIRSVMIRLLYKYFFSSPGPLLDQLTVFAKINFFSHSPPPLRPPENYFHAPDSII